MSRQAEKAHEIEREHGEKHAETELLLEIFDAVALQNPPSDTENLNYEVTEECASHKSQIEVVLEVEIVPVAIIMRIGKRIDSLEGAEAESEDRFLP